MRDANTYRDILEAARRAHWDIEDVIGSGAELDFSRPFLPNGLVRPEPLAFLREDERLALNHIRAHGYLCLFSLAERFILPFVESYIEDAGQEEEARSEALARFAQEEEKHIQLFGRFHREFQRGFGTPCAIIGPAEDIASAVLAHHPLGIALAILHIEWMTQRHYVDCVRTTTGLDAQFSSLLRHHWREEAQHARLDTLMVEELAAGVSSSEIERAVIDYLKIVMLLDDGLAEQVELDLEAFAMATGRGLSRSEQEQLATVQHQAMRWTFLGSGMTHPHFRAALDRLRPQARQKVERLALHFC